MKKIIIIFVSIFAIAISAKAQYIVKAENIDENAYIEQLNQRYIDAEAKIKEGKTGFYSGLGIQLFSGLVYSFPALTGEGYVKDSGMVKGCMFFGSLFFVLGSIDEIIGIVK